MVVRRAGARRHRRVLLRAGAGGAGDEPDRFRHLRARRVSRTCASSVLGNYARLLETPLFWQAFGNTLYFVVVGVPLSIAASLGAALLLHSKLARFKGFFRTALFAPVVTTLVAVAVIWRYLFNTRYGMLNYALAPARNRPHRLARRPALGDARDHRLRRLEELRLQHGHPARGTAEHPGASYYEAARIDGASFVQQFSLRHAADARADAAAW